MADCITRKAAHEMVRNLTRYVNVESREMHGVNEMVDYDAVQHGLDKLSADVVEVVRCQDCKYCNFLLGKSPLCLGGAAWKPIKENDFCAWGERITKNG